MCSSQPVVDLPKMFNALRQYVEEFAPDDTAADEALDEVRDAVDRHAAVHFTECRRKVLELVAGYIRRQQTRVFRHDLA
jgi:hypothetical protein